MESSTQAPATDSSARTFSQVVFNDIPHSYPPSTSVTCCYTLTAAFQPNPRDWVGIFKVGWSTTKDYHTFVWVDPSLDVSGQQYVTRQAVFKDYYLPKDEIEFYQFCYVDRVGQVRGASTPFCFRNPVEQSMESSPDDDLLVITTQEQVEQSVREKTELQKELDQIKEENETLKRALQTERQEAASLKGQNEENKKEMSQLLKEMDQIKEQNENLQSNLQQQLKETDRLKEEALAQMTKQMEIQQHNATEQKKRSQSLTLDEESKKTGEKYDRAVMKINQLKEEREELTRRFDAQSGEINLLNSKLREQERELFKMKDSIQLLQVDLQSSEKEKERLSAELRRSQNVVQNMDDLKSENQELRRRLLQAEALQDCPDDSLRVQCQTLTCQLQDTQAKLAAEKEQSKNISRRVEGLDRELSHVKDQLENVISSYEEAQRKNSKQEILLKEAHLMIADKEGIMEEKEDLIRLVRHEKEELARENQSLMSDIERMRSAYAELQAAPPADSSYMQPDIPSPLDTTSSIHEWQQQETPEEAEHLYETIGSVADPVEQSLVCRHCQESFPLITQQELEQHEQSHRVCPFCTMICDNMEQSVFEDHVYSHEV